ncbi:aminotransferase class I/II-fold pyridoxal phosphate-dependent enzyme [Algoriphagus sediminis]|uniref:Aminotransferase class I/II-fold pyridoxal phosphate-dependent enzyme n=1 Tax=Algoriphagus sediminis TaxID=3057113 RepID=A0ABT7YBK7_9BACT|nr:aminotransferase class I/II-fold pyridoxal phosphate-dependent enzyme [Algoriphagus sediminis]MDN3203878.1 aminotransferase class I/II-fold pyridoxal phosphate-dependent enzyme [Algoriphagus sediminis]
MKQFHLDQKIDRIIRYEGKNYRYFSGTAYLGMGLLPPFKSALTEGMELLGLNHGQSRGNNVKLNIFQEFEDFFAQSAGAEEAIVMSSGYLAGSAALQSCSKSKDIWVAPDTHPAILPNQLIPDSTMSFESWKQLCLEKAERLAPQEILILGNAVDPLTSMIHDYSWLKAIGKKHSVTLIVDDSHAFGLIGQGIFGTYESLKTLPAEVIVSGSLGKGLSLPAGIILCSEERQKKIHGLRMYGGASPCPPAYLYAFLKCQNIYVDQQKKLVQNVKLFSSLIEDINGINKSEDYPVFVFERDEWVEALEEAGFIVSSFHYPTVKDPRINRIIISAFHLPEDLELLSETLHKLS